MTDFLQNFSPVAQALFAGCFTWAMTALGAGAVFVVRDLSRKLLDGVLGFAAGVMIAVSYWSLLAPSVAMSAGGRVPVWLPAAVGFVVGGIVIRLTDRMLPHLHLGFRGDEAEGIKTAWQRNTLLMAAMTLHNIPEGLAIGVAFGAAAAGFPSATIAAAGVLAVGIGIQNLPEGLAISLPFRCEGMSRRRSFWYGQLSAIVEPLAAVVGAAAVIASRPLMPYALSFAAGAMVFVVIEEIVPEAQRSGNKDIVAVGVMLGFVIMMILDVAFGPK